MYFIAADCCRPNGSALSLYVLAVAYLGWREGVLGDAGTPSQNPKYATACLRAVLVHCG